MRLYLIDAPEGASMRVLAIAIVVLLPPVRIMAAGEPCFDIERLILANSRQPELVKLLLTLSAYR